MKFSKRFVILVFSVILVLFLEIHLGRLRQEFQGMFSQRNNGFVSFYPEPDEYIRHCITYEVIGKLPPNLETRPFAGPLTNATEDAKERRVSFDNIFRSKSWLSPQDKIYTERASGPGSTLEYAQEAMAALHSTVTQLKMALGVTRIRLLDIPCGDMVWMSRFLLTRNDVDYTGMDIVTDLIARHRNSSSKHGWKFIEQDVVLQGRLNETYDLIFSRMMLQHLLHNDVRQILKLFSNSGSRFLMATTFLPLGKNTELNDRSGIRFRYLNLELPPISLSPPVCFARDGMRNDEHGRIHFLGLWRLPLWEVVNCNSSLPFYVPGLDDHVYSCTRWN